MALSISEIHEAAKRLQGDAIHTPLITNAYLDSITKGRIFVKPECLQKTGAFKYRGALNKISSLSEEDRKKGVATISSGNHAQAVARVAKQFGIEAIILMPEDTPTIKMEATKGWGATIRTFNRFKDDRDVLFADLLEETGCVAVHAYNDNHIMAGQGTSGLEAAADLVTLGLQPDAALVCCGGGGLTAGFSVAVKDQFPDCPVYACEPEHYDDTRLSLEAGEPIPVSTARPSVCDAIVTAKPGDKTFAVNHSTLQGALVASDEDALKAVAFAFNHLKLVLEPGGAIALAALLTGQIDAKDKTILVMASGGNIDAAMMQKALAL